MRRSVFFAVLFGVLPRLALACPGCNVALGQGQNLALAKGFSYSIYFMLSVVFAVIGLIIARIVYEARQDSPALKPPI
jgi:hypothetical protein